MNKTGIGLLSIILLATSACSNGAETASGPEGGTQSRQNDAQSDVRKDQLNADIRAREQRNKVAGDPNKRADGDLESEVRSKLEANIPGGKLTVKAKDGAVVVSGTVPVQAQISKIEPLSKQIKGVTSVTVKATASS